MPPLTGLIDVQKLDLTADGLRERRRTLPELAQRLQNQKDAAALDQGLAALERKREELNTAERTLAAEVSDVAAKAKKAEGTLYSGTVTSPKELEGLTEELRLHKAKQSELEDSELELMEQIEGTEGEVDANRQQRTENDVRERELDTAIAAAEGVIDGELAVVDGSRREAATDIPAPILETYEGLRAKPRLGGRVVAVIEGGTCQGCRVKLPVLEHKRIRNEPPDALVRCPHCTRIFVR